MARYGEMLRFLGGDPGFIATTVVQAVLAALFLSVVGTWLPLLIRSGSAAREGDESPDTMGDQPLSRFGLFTLSLGGGLMLVVGLGTASALLFKQLMPGVIASIVTGLVTTILLIRQKRTVGPARVGIGVMVILTLVPLTMTLWHHIFTAFPFGEGEAEIVVFSDAFRDSGFHIHLASVLSETGLPLRDLYGSPDHAYSPLVHTGHGVLMGSLALVLRTSIYRASTALWMVAMVLLCWSVATLLSRRSIPRPVIVLGSLCPLFLGPLTMPTLAVLTQPVFAINQLSSTALTAPRMYWNLPQTLTSALTAMSLLCLDGYCGSARSNRRRLNWIVAAAAAIAVSGWVKPSLFIFYGPALLITLIISRCTFRDILTVAGIFAAAVVVYLLPSWLVPVADHPSWSIHPSLEQTQHVLTLLVFGCGPAALLAIGPIRELISRVFRPGDPHPLTVALVAMGGSLLFALLFLEDRFANLAAFRIYQPNLWWGPSACLVLLAPLLIESAVERIIAAGKADWFMLAGLILGSVQIANGILLAVAYPSILGRVYPHQKVDALQAARSRTAPEARFLVDANFLHPVAGFTDLAGYLARPCLFGTSYMDPAEAEILTSWDALFPRPEPEDDEDEDAEQHEEETVSNPMAWSQYEVAIVSEEEHAAKARDTLTTAGWTSEDLSEGYRLWTRPARAEDSGD